MRKSYQIKNRTIFINFDNLVEIICNKIQDGYHLRLKYINYVHELDLNTDPEGLVKSLINSIMIDYNEFSEIKK